MPKISSSRNPHLWPRAARQIAFLEPLSLLVALPFLAASPAAEAREYFVGGPVHEHDMEIVANYLVGIEMAPMPPDMPTGQDVIHLEADVHATADNVYGYPDGASELRGTVPRRERQPCLRSWRETVMATARCHQTGRRAGYAT